MKLQFGRAPEEPAHGDETTVVIVSGACCFPPLRTFDNEARRIVDAAIAEAGVPARVVAMSMAQAYYGGLPKAIADEGKRKKDEVGMAMFPTVLVDLAVVSYGVPTVEAVVAALAKARPTAETAPTGAPSGDIR